MEGEAAWRQKLSPHGSLQLEEGLPAAGVEVTVRLTGKGRGVARQLASSGLQLHAQIDDVVVGHVANATDLQHIAELACVREVELARPLYEDRPPNEEGDLRERGKT
jgi:hypothetical protein